MARARHLVEEQPEVRVERLGDRTLREGFHLLGERVESGRPPARGVRRVHDGLSLDPLDVLERGRNRISGNGNHDDVGIGDVSAVPPERRHVVVRGRPQPLQAAADVAAADDGDLHPVRI